MVGAKSAERLRVNTKGMSVLSIDDTGKFRSCILSASGYTQRCQALSPYGLCTNPPDNSLAVAFNLQNIASNTVALIDDPENRKKGLEKGEVALYNYVTGSVVYLKSDNSIEIESSGGAKITMASDGTIQLNGDADFVTAFTDMKTAFDLAITAINSHTHSGVTTGSGTSGAISAPVVISMDAAKVDTVKVP